MKKHMLSALNRRCADVESNSALVVLATIQRQVFSGPTEKSRVPTGTESF